MKTGTLAILLAAALAVCLSSCDTGYDNPLRVAKPVPITKPDVNIAMNDEPEPVRVARPRPTPLPGPTTVTVTILSPRPYPERIVVPPPPDVVQFPGPPDAAQPRGVAPRPESFEDLINNEGAPPKLTSTAPAPTPTPAPGPLPTRAPAATPRLNSTDSSDASDDPSGDIIPASALRVNNQFITVGDIVRARAEELSAVPKSLPEDRYRIRVASLVTDEIRRQISEAMVMTEASGRLTDEQKKKIDAEVEHACTQMAAELAGGSKTRLEQQFTAQGTTLKAVLENYRRRLTVASYMHQKMAPSIKINRTNLWDYYTKHKDEFTRDKKVQMQIISAPIKEFLPEAEAARPTDAALAAAKKLAREQIDKAAAELKKGRDFGEVAQALSKDAKRADGGVWPLMSAGSFRETKVEAAAFAMAEGQTSDVIETESGFWIVRAKQVQPGSVQSFEDAQQKIEQTLREQQERKMTDEYFAKRFAESTVVEYSHFQELAVDKAVEKYYKK
ncbi:MAG: peptidylprolyl isomerase [Phycisphaerae bacterium]